MSRTEEHIRALCQWPHRGSTSTNEALAAEYARRTLEEQGYQVDIEKFKAPSSGLYPTYMFITGFAGIACILAFTRPLTALIIAAMPLIYVFVEFFFRIPLHNLIFPGGSSQNVTAHSQNHNAKAKLILSAHLDSQVGSFLFSEKWLWFQPILTNGATAGVFAAIILCALRLLGMDGYFNSILLLLDFSFMLFLFLPLAAAEWTGKYVQGASDDASGVAAILALAEDLHKIPPANLEVWIVATGAEESGVCGMSHFMRKGAGAKLDKKSAHFINFDNLGGGDLIYLTGETIPGFKYPGPLLKLAEEVAADPHSPDAGSKWWGVPTDALIPALRGFPTITIFGLDKNNRTPNYHYFTDTVDNVDFELPEKARMFAFDLIRKLDHKLGSD